MAIDGRIMALWGSRASERAWVLGNGDSLNRWDQKIEPVGDFVIGVNRSWTVHPDADYHVSAAARHYHDLADGHHSPRRCVFLSEAIRACRRPSQGNLYARPIHFIRRLEDDAKERVRAELCNGSNAWFSGLLAIHVAAWLGAKQINLVGFDSDGTHHYPATRRVDGSAFLPYYSVVDRWARARGLEIVNRNPESRIRCFAFEPEG